MDYRIVLLFPLLLFLVSCAMLFDKPVKKDIKSRFKAFPMENLPLKAKAQIRWNDYQVPFIKAENDHDCAFLLGMTHAHLRLGQMALMREIVNYRIAEHAGPLATNLEQTLRTMQLFTAVDSIYASLPPETLSWLTDYVSGINYYQEQISELPVEMRKLSIKPTLWSVTDVLKLGRLISADVNWFNWFSLIRMQDKSRWKEYWKFLVKHGGGSVASSNKNLKLPEKLLQSKSKSGSNAYAIAPHKTTMNSAIMASDPHLGLQLPNMWMIAGYQCPSYHVLGLMFPGIPMVMVGRNEQISWSGTNMRSASSDLYELGPEEVLQLKSSQGKIKVRWWFDRKFTLRFSPIGPVISDAPYLKSKGKTLAMRWVGHQVSDEMTAILKMNRATDWHSFTEAFRTYAVSGQNFLYADNAGHIGLLPAVKIPVRKYSLPPDLSMPASNDSLKWHGFLDSSDLPNIYDPEEGFVASANNQPVKTMTPLSFFFSADDRIRRLQNRLSNDNKIDLSSIVDLQTDTFVISALETVNVILDKLKEIHTEQYSSPEQQVLLTLKEWNGKYDIDEKAPVIYQMLLYYFCTDYFSNVYGEEITKYVLASDMVNDIVKAELLKSNQDVNSGLNFAFRETVQHQNRYDNWGEMHHLPLNHVLGNIPVLGKSFRFGDVPVGGTFNSLMKTAHHVSNKETKATYGADARFISILDDEKENYFVLLGGQDGWIGSPGLIDQVPLWLQGGYMRIPFKWIDVEKDFKRLMMLIPQH